jgi:hypothetical protein
VIKLLSLIDRLRPGINENLWESWFFALFSLFP